MNTKTSTSLFTASGVLMLATAIMFDLFKAFFVMLIIFAPLIAGAGAAGLAGKTLGVGATGKAIAGGAVAVGGYALEATGAGAAVVEGFGEMFADIIDFFAWLTFLIWFKLYGIKMFGGKRGNKRFIMSMAFFLLGEIPFINAFPTITVGIAFDLFTDYQDRKDRAAKEKLQIQAELERFNVIENADAERSLQIARQMEQFAT